MERLWISDGQQAIQLLCHPTISVKFSFLATGGHSCAMPLLVVGHPPRGRLKAERTCPTRTPPRSRRVAVRRPEDGISAKRNLAACGTVNQCLLGTLTEIYHLQNVYSTTDSQELVEWWNVLLEY